MPTGSAVGGEGVGKISLEAMDGEAKVGEAGVEDPELARGGNIW